MNVSIAAAEVAIDIDNKLNDIARRLDNQSACYPIDSLAIGNPLPNDTWHYHAVFQEKFVDLLTTNSP